MKVYALYINGQLDTGRRWGTRQGGVYTTLGAARGRRTSLITEWKRGMEYGYRDVGERPVVEIRASDVESWEVVE